jgi:hypothetical protein
MVSVRQVVATPMTAGAYFRMTLSRPFLRLGPPPNTACFSPRAEEAMSMGSRKWLMM